MTKRLCLALGIALTLLACIVVPAQAAPTDRHWPVQGPVTRIFDPPDTPWGSGHRGIDIDGTVGADVRAAADGIVSWVGVIDGVPSLSVSHDGGVRTTYQPVRSRVHKGQFVSSGEVIATLEAGHGDGSALHLGLLRGHDYLDPLEWLLTGMKITSRVRLLGKNDQVTPTTNSIGALLSTEIHPGISGKMPVGGPITSPFGWRINPVLGTRELHDGIDIGAPCGTPVRSPWSGVVTRAGSDRWNGIHVELTHNPAHGSPGATRYLHFSKLAVRKGQHVSAGQVIGLVGTTGLSTGCHLHFTTVQGGRAVDPRVFIS